LTDLQSEDEAEEGEVPVELKKAKDISFTRNKSSGLILPPMTDYKKIQQKQAPMLEPCIVSPCIPHLVDRYFERHNRRLYWELNSHTVSLPRTTKQSFHQSVSQMDCA
jgi:hypothetical protein